jgi:O-antigen/teichoic acid export membrane protein
MKQLWASIAHTSGAKVYTMLIGVIILALTARILGPDGRGQIIVITTWVGMFSTFAYLSLGQVALSRMVSDPDHQRFNGVLGALIMMVLVVTLFCWLVGYLMYWWGIGLDFRKLPLVGLLIGSAALPFMIWEQYSSSLLMGLGRIGTYNFAQIVGRTLSLLVIVLLVVLLDCGVNGVLIGWFLGQIIVALGGIVFLIKFAQEKGRLFPPDKIETKALLLGGAKLHLNAIGSFLFSSANLLILNHYHTSEAVGYFQMANQLLGVIMIIPSSAGMVIYGKVTRLGPNQAWPDNKRLLIQALMGVIVIGTLAALIAPQVITILAGETFHPAVEPFQWMLFGLIGMTFSSIMAPQWVARGYFWQTAGITILVGLISLVMNFLLIPFYGINGAVWAFLGTYLVSIVCNSIMALHCEKEYKRTLLR